MLFPILAILCGFLLLVWSSDKFVDGASELARFFGVPPLIIGITIVGLGTSAPEMLISGFAAFEGNPHLAIGNAIGSNIANIALILGVTAMIIPLSIHSRILKLELPILLGATVFALFLLMDNRLGRLDGVLLITTLLAIMTWLVRDAMVMRDKQKTKDALESEMEQEMSKEKPVLGKTLLILIIGLIVLLASAKLLVWGAVRIATELGVSDLVIGLTIIAIGTSLPELAASITSAKRNEPDIAIGNVIGSNLFNMLGVLSIPALIAPSQIPTAILSRDYPVMLGLTIILFFLAFGLRSRQPGIGRIAGALLLIGFISYQVILFFSETGAT